MTAGAKQPSPVLRQLLRVPSALYDWHAGWLLGGRFLRLTHVGRRSGMCHHTVLEVVGHDRDRGEVIVMAGFGQSADWYRNIQAQPAVEVIVGRQRFSPIQRMLDEDEAVNVLADYERRNRWISPVVHRVLSWLVGWPYSGKPEERRKIVRQLPLVAFRPPAS